MMYQTALYRLKGFFPLPRALNGIKWISMGLLCASIGIFSAGIFENRFLNVPFQTRSFIPAVEKKADKPIGIEEFEPIITYNIFNAEVSDSELTEKVDLVPTKPGKNLKQILSNLQLMGISVLQGQYAVCVIQDKKERTEEIFAIDDSVFDTRAIVRKIQTRNREQKVYLQLDDEIGVLTYKEETISEHRPISSRRPSSNDRNKSANSSNQSDYTSDGKNFHISSGEVDARLNDFASLLNQARMVPYFRKGKHQGYQVKAIDKGSLYEKLGLKNNDVIQEVNGEPLDSMEKVMELFNKFRNEREFTIKLNRKGSPQFMNYYID